jgi:hypothetical protein
MINEQKNDQVVAGVCLIIGQLLHTLSTFYWDVNGRHLINGSVMVILAMSFWAVGFVGLFNLFREKNPWYARLGLWYAFYGCLGGIGFGFEGLYSVIFQVEKIGMTAYEKFPLQMNLVLYWAGPAFPLTLLIMGILLMVRKIAPWWIGLMIAAGAIVFPVSRVTRIPSVAHIADIVLLIPIVFISVNFIRDKQIS